MSSSRPASTTSFGAGSPSPSRRSRSWRSWTGGSPRVVTPSAKSCSGPMQYRTRDERLRGSTARRLRSGSERCRRSTRAVLIPTPCGTSSRRRSSRCRSFRRPRSARCRRPPTSVPPERRSRVDRRAGRTTTRFSGRRPNGRSAGRRRSESTCSFTASSSATTWSSTSPSSSTATPSRPPAGFRATAHAASGRRSSSATSSRPAAMTVQWSTYAQSLTERPVKGMLTGPVTMMQWSFVRDDLPARDDLPTDRARTPGRGRRPRNGGHPRRSRSTSPLCARASRCGPATGATISPGPSSASGSPRPESTTGPRSTRTCATRTSTTSSSRSGSSTPT